IVVSHPSTEKKPVLSKDVLVEMGGWAAYHEAERLVASDAVKECIWEAPVLHGRVEFAGQVFFPKINLRSTLFAENRCSCVKGRQGMVCAHALALCYYFAQAPKAVQQEGIDIAEAAQMPVLRHMKISDGKGIPLAFKVFLPPNLPQTAPRDAMVIKVDAFIKGRLIALEHLDRGRAYKMKPATYRMAALLENWFEKDWFGIMQLNRARLCELLEALRDEPAVFWSNQPERPIAWVDGKLSGVHNYLDVADEPASLKKSSGEVKAIDAPPVPLALTSVTPMQVDGSPNYLAITLPARESAVYGPALELVKNHGFELDPTSRQWWLRDRHKVLNFLSRYWVQMKDQWDAQFSRNFRQQFSNIKFVEVACQAQELGKDYNFKIEIKAGKAKSPELLQSISLGQN
ncbi:MAG: hypothetical protein B7X06_04000, partial [Verrucomicrobia bacterium 21-51-4]